MKANNSMWQRTCEDGGTVIGHSRWCERRVGLTCEALSLHYVVTMADLAGETNAQSLSKEGPFLSRSIDFSETDLWEEGRKPACRSTPRNQFLEMNYGEEAQFQRAGKDRKTMRSA